MLLDDEAPLEVSESDLSISGLKQVELQRSPGHVFFNAAVDQCVGNAARFTFDNATRALDYVACKPSTSGNRLLAGTLTLTAAQAAKFRSRVAALRVAKAGPCIADAPILFVDVTRATTRGYVDARNGCNAPHRTPVADKGADLLFQYADSFVPAPPTAPSLVPANATAVTLSHSAGFTRPYPPDFCGFNSGTWTFDAATLKLDASFCVTTTGATPSSTLKKASRTLSGTEATLLRARLFAITAGTPPQGCIADAPIDILRVTSPAGQVSYATEYAAAPCGAWAPADSAALDKAIETARDLGAK